MTAQEFYHIVKQGETIKSIANKYKITENDLIELNPDISTRFHVGMQIAIPSKTNQQRKNGKENETHTMVVRQEPQSTQHTTNTTISSIDEGWVQGMDYHLLLDPDAKTYGLRMSADNNEWLHLAVGMDMEFVKHGAGDFYVGLGLGKKYVLGSLLFFANAYPYAGFIMQDKMENDKWTSDTEFTFSYGAMGTAGIGLKIHESDKGKKYYLSGGYTVNAFKFKTKNLFKNGTWLVGITIVE